MHDTTAFLRSLEGRPLRTVTGRQNRILDVQGDTVLVWTSRSPSGQPVPVAWFQDALDRLIKEGDRDLGRDRRLPQRLLWCGVARVSRCDGNHWHVTAPHPALSLIAQSGSASITVRP